MSYQFTSLSGLLQNFGLQKAERPFTWRRTLWQDESKTKSTRSQINGNSNSSYKGMFDIDSNCWYININNNSSKIIDKNVDIVKQIVFTFFF